VTDNNCRHCGSEEDDARKTTNGQRRGTKQLIGRDAHRGNLEVCDLDVALGVEEDGVGTQIAVYDVFSMEVA
jgi:hypothetical protein